MTDGWLVLCVVAGCVLPAIPISIWMGRRYPIFFYLPPMLEPLKDKTMTEVSSTSDERTVNNTMRHAYRVLSHEEKANMQSIKDAGLAFHDQIQALGNSREISLAKTKVEEAVMWAVKHITA